MIDLMTFQTFGQQAILINWALTSYLDRNEDILNCAKWIESHFEEEVSETVPTYQSLAVYLKPKVHSQLFIERLKKSLDKISEETWKELLATAQKSKGSNYYLYTIPVCYHHDFGLDLAELAKRHDLLVDDVIEIHTSPIYRVEFIGFLPGFPYLSGLDQRLSTPRKAAPRASIGKGAVGIGGNQTGIYSLPSPGGWNIIGKTPVTLFDPYQKTPSLFKAGDYLRFVPVSKAVYKLTELEVASDTFHIEKEAYHD